MPYELRFECNDYSSFVTTRTRNSELWFVNNDSLQERIVAYLAKYQTTYNVTLYAFAPLGNHHHQVAKFPVGTRACFMRDFNSMTARLTKTFQPRCPDGAFWYRRYANQILAEPEDIEEQFFYCALQPVSSGLVERISDYPGYNSFQDAILGRKRTFVLVDRAAYNRAKKHKRDVRLVDYKRKFTLTYARLPGYEDLSPRQYEKLMLKKLEERRLRIIAERKANKQGFATRAILLKTKPGSRPRSTKKSTRDSFRPIVLARRFSTKRHVLNHYFTVVEAHRRASRKYRQGDQSVVFPPGTYKPPTFC